MLQKVLDSMQKEYDTLVKCLDPQTGYDWALENPQRLINNAQHRVVGVFMFAQEYLDVKYEDINKPFEEFVEKIKELEKKCLTNKK